MSINEILQKIKPYYTFFLLVVIGSIFFALGRLSSEEIGKTRIRIEYPNTDQSSLVLSSVSSSTNKESNSNISNKVVSVPVLNKSNEVIGSKSGKKYYFPWCGTVKRIKPENQIHFASIDEAKKAGFTPGGNCKGLQ